MSKIAITIIFVICAGVVDAKPGCVDGKLSWHDRRFLESHSSVVCGDLGNRPIILPLP